MARTVPTRRPRPAAALRLVAGEWRTFGRPPFRRYAALAAAQGLVSTLAGPSVLVPLLLDLGLGAGPTTLIASLALAGPAVQLGVPGLLRRTDGNLRGVTLVAITLGETRGLWLAAVAAAVALGALPTAALVVAAALALAVAGTASGVGAANLQAWFAAILPEADRRFVGPRVAGMAAAVGALALLPLAAALRSTTPTETIAVCTVPFAVAGLAGLGELRVVGGLRRPGRVRVPRLASAEVPDPGRLKNFLTMATIAAFGSGLAPYLSAYAMAVLGASAGVGVALGAVTGLSSIITTTVVAALLARRSASRFLRLAYVLLAGGWLFGLAAFPGDPAAGAVLLVVAIVVSAGGAIVTLAVTERLFRLAPGPAAIPHQGRFVASTAAGTTAGQLLSATILTIGQAAYPAFAILLVATGSVRLMAAAKLEVADSWAASTSVWQVDELGTRR